MKKKRSKFDAGPVSFDASIPNDFQDSIEFRLQREKQGMCNEVSRSARAVARSATFHSSFFSL